jgi:toluene monooxygenase system protein A
MDVYFLYFLEKFKKESGKRYMPEPKSQAGEELERQAGRISARLRRTVEYAKRLGKGGSALKEAAEFYIAKSYWLNWRAIAALTGASMDYLTPLDGRIMSFREFIVEWVGAQFKRQLEDYGIELPWFWRYWEEETKWWHHSFELGIYLWRRTLNLHNRGPTPEERRWLEEKYPGWGETFGRFWDLYAKNYIEGRPPLPKTAPLLCNMCQVPLISVKPGRHVVIYQKVYNGRLYNFCSPVCMWIWEQEKERYAGHMTYVDRLLAGKIKLSPEAMGSIERLWDEIIWHMGYTEFGEAGLDATNGAWALLYKEKDPNYERRVERWMEARP